MECCFLPDWGVPHRWWRYGLFHSWSPSSRNWGTHSSAPQLAAQKQSTADGGHWWLRSLHLLVAAPTGQVVPGGSDHQPGPPYIHPTGLASAWRKKFPWRLPVADFRAAGALSSSSEWLMGNSEGWSSPLSPTYQHSAPATPAEFLLWVRVSHLDPWGRSCSSCSAAAGLLEMRS